MSIAYLPIEIDVRLPDPQIILDYIDAYQLKTKHTTWKIAPILGRVNTENWYEGNAYANVIYNRYNTSIKSKTQYANNIDKLMPEIPYMLSQLPFKQLTFGLLLEQMTEVTKHHDVQAYDIYNDLTEIEHEPRRFNILMTRHSEKAFYLSESLESENVYPIITKENPCFAFNERHYLHGSDYIGPNKVMIMAGGIIDKKKFKDMIDRNLKKFKDQVIIFPDRSPNSVIRIGSGIE
jgi:hypothetical protein